MNAQNIGNRLLQQSILRVIQQRFIETFVGLSLATAVFMLFIDAVINDTKAQPLLIPMTIGIAIIYFITRQGKIEGAALGIISLLTFIGVVTRFTDFSSYSVPISLAAILIIALLGQTRLYIIATSIILGTHIAASIIAAGHLSLETRDVLDLTILFLIAIILRFFATQIQSEILRAERNTLLLESNASLAQRIPTLFNLQDLLDQTVNLIRDEHGFYHVQIFLLNEERDQAVLAASTGAVGRQLLKRNHHLNVGSQSVIGQVTLQGKYIVARDNDTSSVHARNELLPNTRAELALPLLIGTTVIGALDVQSLYADAFHEDDIRALEVCANLVATAIRNTRLFENQRKIADENQRLLLEANLNINEIERLNRRMTRENWDDYLSTQADVTGLTLSGNNIEMASNWSEALITAGQTKTTIISQEPNQNLIALPIILRGEVIGAIEIEQDTPLTDQEQLSLVESISQRLALSLDNARLFQEAQRAALQEQRINEIVTGYQSVTTIDELLQLTIKELAESLGAQSGSIRLGRISAESQEEQHA